MNKLDKKKIEDILALTPLQEGMLFHYQKEPKSNLYFEQLSLEVSGEIDAELFEKAWNVVIGTNETLRTVFRWEKLEKPTQIILKENKCNFAYYDLSSKDSSSRKVALEKIKNSDRLNIFDLRKVPFRVILCKKEEKEYEVIISNHHILYDGWSNGILLKNFFNAYHKPITGKRSTKSPVKSSYKDFVKWIYEQDKNKQDRFWREYLDGLEVATDLPIKRKKTLGPRDAVNYPVLFEQGINERLDIFVKNNRVTSASVFYSAWGVLLQKYCNREDVIFGTTVSGRASKIKGIEEMVGLFINTIPLRVRTFPAEKIVDVINRVDNVLPKREEFENTPLVEIAESSALNGAESLFDTIVVIENYPIDSRLIPGGSSLSIRGYSIAEMTHYDLTVGIMLSEKIEIGISYNRALFNETAIENLAMHFKGIVQKIVETPDVEVSRLQIISPEEKNRLLYDFNKKGVEYPGDKTIHGLFEEQVERTPDHLAVVFTSTQITYKELNEKAGRLAQKLWEEGSQPGDIVGIMLERSIEMIVGILGILKSGAAYLPLNPKAPGSRTKYMIKDSGVKIILNDELAIVNCESLIGSVEGGRNACPAQPLNFSTSQLLISAFSVAYIIYTSGSTGKPKGVPITHANVSPLLHWGYDHLGLTSDDRSVQNLSYYFDWSVWEIFITLTSGASLYMVSSDVLLDTERYVDLLDRYRITALHITPTHFQTLIQGEGKLNTLRYLCIGAEKLTVELVRRSYESLNGKCRVYNMYGPTEATIMAAVLEIEKSNLSNYKELSSAPIGKTLGNNVLMVLDRDLNLCPVNVPGELYIGGEGVASGYLNNPELTAEKFIHPAKTFVKELTLSANTNTLYRTGDRAKWLDDGTIEFLGRIDQQVKIRGFRIELGEIVNRILSYEKIKEAEVIVRDRKNDGGASTERDKYLCAYIVPDGEVSIPGLKSYLSAELPDYMVPSYFVQIEKMPLNPNGKINLAVLPEPGIKIQEGYTAPRGPLEEKLAEIWEEVLGISGRIGIDDNFFHLGGHSLKATTLVYRIYKGMNFEIEIMDIFAHPTIRELIPCMKKREGIEYSEIAPVEEKEYYELSYAQRRLWIVCQFEEDSTTYNIPTAVVLTGAINLEAFGQAAQTLSNRHESIRTIFISVNGEPRQKVLRDYKFNLETIDLRHMEIKEREEKARRLYLDIANGAFDLEKGPLFRLAPIHIEDEKYILVYNMHHIIDDGWSQGIIHNELITLYNSYCRESENPLAPLELQYKDYSRWHNHLVEGGYFDKIGTYWQEKFKDKPNGIELPYDHPRKPVQTFNGARVDFIIDKERTARLQQLTLTEDVTFFMSLLTLLNIFLYKYTGQKDIIIGAPIANRKKPELHRMVGFLVNTLVYRNIVDPMRTFKQSLASVKKEALECYERQDFPFDLLMEQLQLERDLSQSPLFNVMIAHNNTGTENKSLEMEGLDISDYPYSGDFNMSKFDLTVFMDEMDYGVQTRFEYNSDLFDRSTIERMAVNFLVLADLVIENSDIPISTLNILSGKEYETVTRSFNDTHCDFPRLTLQELFEAQVEKLKDKIAAIDHEDTITYEDLNKKANRVAHYLRGTYSVKPNEVIAISMDRSIEMIIVILGVLKSGAAYLAVDPTYPRDRVLHILQDSRSKLLIIDKMRPELFGDYPGETLDILSQMGAIDKEPCNNPGIITQPSDVLYVNYTSGSTGTPNGAMLSHDCLTNLIRWQNEETGIDCSLRCLQFTSINFCVSFQEIMGTLTSGGDLHLIGDIERQDIDYLMNFLSSHQIEILFLPFSYLNFLFNESGRWDRTFKSNLKHIITAGEQLKITTGLKRFLNSNPHLQLHNHYGSTEMHVVTSYTLDASTAEKTPIPPAGRPISNIAIYIVDDYFNPAPIGAYGELCVAGSTEILGYIHNKGLTEKKLVECPVLSGMKLYRSGDIGRWLPDGNIELRGRKDFLVKVRGFRVELGEIESKILSIENVRECVVVVKEDERSQKYLVAYVSADGIDERGIKRIIGTVLPQYMLPKIIIMDSLPLMPNGKVDREKLPDTHRIGIDERVIMPPVGEIESTLAKIWSELLGIEINQLGSDDNFFELGGHSLKAVTMMSNIHKELNVKVELLEIFRNPTIRDIAQFIQGLKKDAFQSLEPVEEKDYFLLSSAQKRLYILQQIVEGNTAYNMPGVMELKGVLNITKFEDTFRRLVDRHESFRTSFHIVEGEPVQRIENSVEFKIEYFELAIIKTFIRFFDLSKAPLLRVGIIRLEEEKHIMMVDMSHIISDGISIGVLVREFMILYGDGELPPLRVQYKDYSEWRKSEKQLEAIREQEAYWLRQFDGDPPVLALPMDYLRSSVQSFEGGVINFEVTPVETGELKALALKANATLYIVALSVYYLFLSKLSGEEDIVVGTPVAGRNHADLQNVIGMFVNTLALRNYPLGEKRFIRFLGEVRTRTLESFSNQDYPYEDLVEKTQPPRDAGRNPLFDVFFTLQNVDIPEAEIPGLTISPYDYERKLSKFDLILSGSETGDKLLFEFEYSATLFRKETILRFATYFKRIIAAVVENSEIKLSEIEIIPGEEKQRILNEFNNTGVDYPKDKTIHELFEEQVLKTPDHLAVVFLSGQITYRELSEKSDLLAVDLIARGSHPGEIVAIDAGYSVEIIIGLLGILKAGGAYLPIDPDFPSERVDFMLKDSGAKIILMNSDVGDRHACPINSLTLTNSANTCYIIYTSGSTGRPKGVLTQHRNVARLVKSAGIIDWREGQGLLMTGAIIFDIATFEIWGALLNGLCLYRVGKDIIMDTGKLSDVAVKNKVSILHLIPQLFYQVLEQKPEIFASLDYFLVGGDMVRPAPVARLRNKYPDLKIIHAYGPTENTTFSTTFRVDKDYEERIPIGKPIANSTVYIVDRNNNLQPIGAPGELLVGGDGVAQGYLNNPELTAERFTKTLYKTGDLGRWLPCGNIEYLGRTDSQVKIRGFRIELGEIESRLLDYKSIKEAVAVIRERPSEGEFKDNYLCAYLVSNETVDIPGLKTYLSGMLPDYMIPYHITQIETIPLMFSGKVDRKSLPEPGIISQEIYAAPQTWVEVKLQEIWRDVLKTPGEIGIDDNFFELGGHSLRATVLLSQIHKEFNVMVPLSEIFKRSTIRGLGLYIKEAKEERYTSIEQVEKKEYYALSSSQKRMYILQQADENDMTYNMTSVVTLDGELDTGRFERTFRQLIERHESIRTSFHVIGWEPAQRIHENVEFKIDYFELAKDLGPTIKNFIRPFNLSQAPLLRIGLIRIEEGKHILMVDMSHIISDGTSMKVFIGDFMAIYEGKELPILRIQYKDFSVWQNNKQGTESIKKQEYYWLNQFRDEAPSMELPSDYPLLSRERKGKNSSGDRFGFQIDPEDVNIINKFIQEENVTLFMFLLSVYVILLHKLTWNEDIVVGTPVMGREHEELQRLIGVFINTLAIRSYPSHEKTFRDFLNEIKHVTLHSLESQGYPFEELVEKLQTPPFDTMFVLQNFDIPAIEIPGLTLKNYGYKHPFSRFDLTFIGEEENEALKFIIEYRTSLFTEKTIELFSNYFKEIVHIVTGNRYIRLIDIDIAHCFTDTQDTIYEEASGNFGF